MSDEQMIEQLSKLGRGITPEESAQMGHIAELDAMRQRAEAAELALSAEFVYDTDLVNRYGVEQWRSGARGKPSQEFADWKARNEHGVQPGDDQ